MSESEAPNKPALLDVSKLASSGSLGTIRSYYEAGSPWLVPVALAMSLVLLGIAGGLLLLSGKGGAAQPAPAATATLPYLPTESPTPRPPTSTPTTEPTPTATPTLTPTPSPTPRPTWTPTPRPTPTPEPVTYTVESGDTLGAIAREHEVALADLIEANDLDDPNRLSVGQVLIIPVAD